MNNVQYMLRLTDVSGLRAADRQNCSFASWLQEDRQAQQCPGSGKWDGGRLSPMP